MSARLSIAIEMADAAEGILQKTKSVPQKQWWKIDPEPKSVREHIGVEPMLLALSMELALKAWWVFDYDDSQVRRSHNLEKLFDDLSSESQRRLEVEFKRSVMPYHPEFFYDDYSIRDVLSAHKNAFVDWRYLHEVTHPIGFNHSRFEATLEMVLREFRKRYRTVLVNPVWGASSGSTF